ncbi:hypothetical protein Y032_0428g1278 [Ancylostoma ceylanicum]|uniref:Sulfotransferase domain-containing protein n=1 Tax=Ancylostoma ceylanicum TaxID=53326 RepID=A0A016X0G2_9BILA|nr:hypothetical protein Y032_0428g1278 [Ancylostoma ceylanicum]
MPSSLFLYLKGSNQRHQDTAKSLFTDNSAKKLWSAQRNLLNYCAGDNAAACVPPLRDFACGYKIADKYKLLACTIAKNFSTVLTAILCYLFDERGFLEDGRNLTSDNYHFRFCANRNEYDSLATIYEEQSFDPNVWGMVAVVRDPFERFVSGFADKCLRKQTWRQFPHRCNRCRKNLTCFMERQYERMMSWKGGYHKLGNFDDHHFFPQNWRCDFNSHFNDYHILKFDTFNPSQLIDGLAAILRKHHVPESSIDYIKTSLSMSRTPHSTMGTAEQEETKQAILSNKYLMELLIKMYFYDYVLLGFPLPAFDISNQ